MTGDRKTRKRATRPADAGRDRAIRLAETVGPYGPGAIIDILGESFMAPTGDEWPSERFLNEVECKRLSERLQVTKLYAAPSHGESSRGVGMRLTFSRFPSWLFCQKCRRLQRLRAADDDGSMPLCSCSGRLVPMRFVAGCTDHSHVQDVDWPRWLHAGPVPDSCDPQHDIQFVSNDSGFGLASLELRCGGCRAVRAFDELDGNRLRGAGVRCGGKQPWQRAGAAAQCEAALVVQQRGATSLHIGESISAIDIPEVVGRAVAVEDAIKRDALFAGLQQQEEDAFRTLLAERIAANVGGSVEQVLRVADDSGALQLAAARRDLLRDEFEAFEAAAAGEAPIENFVTRIMPFAGAGPSAPLNGLFEHVVLVDRLREVRAAVEFRRYRMDAKPVPAVLGRATESRWLPAVEGWGEGIFVRLNGEAIEAWSRADGVEKRVLQVKQNQAASSFATRFPEATPKYVLLHGLAHMLIQELAFSSGFTAASLRERIYAGEGGDAGIFLYTTTSDFEGTLGGLVRQGERERFAALVARALERHEWCANDPVCRESGPQSLQGLNLAACHTCMLISETSCEASNLLLDRACVVGNDQIDGLFSFAMDEMRRHAIMGASGG